MTAAGAAGVGARVALVEDALLGGDCLNVGCVPSKALLHSARVAWGVKDGLGGSGISVEGVSVDFGRVMERMREVRAGISGADSAQRFAGMGVDVYLGRARFTGRRTVEVGGTEIEFRKAVVATGASPALVPMDGLQDLLEMARGDGETRPAVMTNESFFNMTVLPERLVVFGAGVVGMEMGQAMQRLGSQVTILARSGEVLAKEDKDLAALVKAQMEDDGVQFRLSLKDSKAIRLTGKVMENGLPEMELDLEETVCDDDGQETVVPLKIQCDAVLIATGRKPSVTGMGLEEAGIDYDEKTGLIVNDRLQTTNSRVFGVGDCCSAFKFTHAADFMARTVIRNALFFGRGKMSSLLIPSATYTSPEIASVGMHESELVERGIDFEVYEKPFSASDRAICEDATVGMVRIRADPKSGKILGANVCGADAGNMICEITLAMQSGTGLGDLASVIHPYPTTADSIRAAGDLYNRGRLTDLVRNFLQFVIKVQR